MRKRTVSPLEPLRRLRDWYWKKKYFLVGRLLGRRDIEADFSRRGLLAIQIDGLSYEMLRQAMQSGYCPFLRRLLRRRFSLRRYNCGFPGNTPAAHAALFYNARNAIPGFRWYERDTGDRINFFNPIDAGIVEARLNQSTEPALLEGGSSYANTFSGKARRAVLCYGSATDSNYVRKLRGFHILFIMLLNIVPIVRAAILSAIELLAEVYEWLFAALKHWRQRVEFFFPITRIVEGVWVQEIVTQGAMLEIVRGSPAIFVTYLSYDSNAHQRGCNRPIVLRKLVSIDRRLRRIVRLAQRRIIRTYDVYILSDHGQTPSEPFLHKYGEELEEYIQRVLNVPPGAPPPPLPEPASFVSLLLRSLQPYERSVARAVPWVLRKFRQFVVRRAGTEPAASIGRGRLVVAPSGPMAHVYLPSRTRLSDADINSRYPQLIAALLQHPGIGIVATVQDGTLILRSRSGEALVTEGEFIERGNPLKGIEEKMRIAMDIRRVSLHQHAGDLIVFGAYSDNFVINFEHQMSAHGGIGGQQQSAFIFYTRALRAAGRIQSLEDIRSMMLRTRQTVDRPYGR